MSRLWSTCHLPGPESDGWETDEVWRRLYWHMGVSTRGHPVRSDVTKLVPGRSAAYRWALLLLSLSLLLVFSLILDPGLVWRLRGRGGATLLTSLLSSVQTKVG